MESGKEPTLSSFADPGLLREIERRRLENQLAHILTIAPRTEETTAEEKTKEPPEIRKFAGRKIYQSETGGTIIERKFEFFNTGTGKKEGQRQLLALVPLPLPIRPWWEPKDLPHYLCVAIDTRRFRQPLSKRETDDIMPLKASLKEPLSPAAETAQKSIPKTTDFKTEEYKPDINLPIALDWENILDAVEENLRDDDFTRTVLYNAYSLTSAKGGNIRREYYPPFTVYQVDREGKKKWVCGPFAPKGLINPHKFSGRAYGNRAISIQLAFMALAETDTSKERNLASPPKTTSEVEEETDWLPEVGRFHPELTEIAQELQRRGIRLIETRFVDGSTNWAAEQALPPSNPSKDDHIAIQADFGLLQGIDANPASLRLETIGHYLDENPQEAAEIFDALYEAPDAQNREEIIININRFSKENPEEENPEEEEPKDKWELAWLTRALQEVGGIRRIGIELSQDVAGIKDQMIITRQILEKLGKILIDIFPASDASDTGAKNLWEPTGDFDTEILEHQGFEIPYFVPEYGIYAKREDREEVYSRANDIKVLAERTQREVSLKLSEEQPVLIIRITRDKFQTIGGENVKTDSQEEVRETTDFSVLESEFSDTFETS